MTYSRSETGWDIPGPTIVLDQPQMGENIGAAARAMWNFGLQNMRLIAPRDGWPNERASAMASGATHILEHARTYPDLEAAIADQHTVFATTARPREMTKQVYAPDRATEVMRDMIRSGQRVAVLFGRERTGLENSAIARAQAVITVPVNPAFYSLNLAQCVLLVAYEWSRQVDETPPETFMSGRTGLAEQRQVMTFLNFLEQELDNNDFFNPIEKRLSMIEALRNTISRMPWTDADIRMLWGVVRHLAGLRQR